MTHMTKVDKILYKMTHSFLGGLGHNTKKTFQESQIGSPPLTLFWAHFFNSKIMDGVNNYQQIESFVTIYRV